MQKLLLVHLLLQEEGKGEANEPMSKDITRIKEQQNGKWKYGAKECCKLKTKFSHYQNWILRINLLFFTKQSIINY